MQLSYLDAAAQGKAPDELPLPFHDVLSHCATVVQAIPRETLAHISSSLTTQPKDASSSDADFMTGEIDANDCTAKALCFIETVRSLATLLPEESLSAVTYPGRVRAQGMPSSSGQECASRLPCMPLHCLT